MTDYAAGYALTQMEALLGYSNTYVTGTIENQQFATAAAACATALRGSIVDAAATFTTTKITDAASALAVGAAGQTLATNQAALAEVVAIQRELGLI
ncbi:MAG: hypothetical protein NVSMB20_03140 [Bradyrhizobium sp.]